MPAVFTHIQFGNAVASTLPAPLRALTEKHPAAFYLGTQGPDVLFYHKPFRSKKKNPIRKRGWDTHAQAAAPFFVQLAKKINKAPSDALKAFAVGFLCHFTLDCTTHPFIDAHSKDGLAHGKIESELDKYFLKKLGRPAYGFNGTTLFSPSEESVQTGMRAFDIPEKNMRILLKSMRRINGLFTNEHGFVRGFCHVALTLIGQNGTLGQMFIHKKDDARCVPLLPTIEALFHQAVGKASAQITAYFSHLEQIARTERIEDDFYRYTYSGFPEEEDTDEPLQTMQAQP